MDEVVRKDILSVLAATMDALGRHDYVELSAISNRTIHNAAIYQDEDSLAVAVLVYALGKVEQRFEEQEATCPNMVPKLQAADGLLSKDDEEGFRAALKGVLAEIERLDGKLHLYIDEVLQKARLKKGSKLHEHGISIARAAEMLGISQWELMSYVGKTSVPETRIAKEDARKRFRRAQEMFG